MDDWGYPHFRKPLYCIGYIPQQMPSNAPLETLFHCKKMAGLQPTRSLNHPKLGCVVAFFALKAIVLDLPHVEKHLSSLAGARHLGNEGSKGPIQHHPTSIPYV